MNSILVLVVGIGILIAGYVFYGKWLVYGSAGFVAERTSGFSSSEQLPVINAISNRHPVYNFSFLMSSSFLIQLFYRDSRYCMCIPVYYEQCLPCH